MNLLSHRTIVLAGCLLIGSTWVLADDPTTTIDVNSCKKLHSLSRLTSGACIEDVNHEIYGGVYSQMVFGESFQEPASMLDSVQGFRKLGGVWQVRGEELRFTGDLGCKLVSDVPAFADGEVSVEINVPERGLVNAGLIVFVGRAQVGADNFDGYELALNADRQQLLLGRHQQNFRALDTVPCKVKTGGWVTLTARISGTKLEVLVDGQHILTHDEGAAALTKGTFGLRQWQGTAQYRNLRYTIGGETKQVPFKSTSNHSYDISGMWSLAQSGTAKGTFAFETKQPFAGTQSQRITFTEGQGRVGIANQGLNRWGMHFVQDRPYGGTIWARCESATKLLVTLENQDGSEKVAESEVTVAAGDWQKVNLQLSPSKTISSGRLAIGLTQSGSVALGYVSLQPADWGQFKGLPIRRDVVEGLLEQGVTFMRYGGSMVNHPQYRWKKMIGPRDRRPPYQGLWYPYSTNGWGIVDFMDMCEAMDVEYVPAFNMDETPQDMADFMQYINGAEDSEWGRKRAADGHPKPYRLKYVQLGNEERVDDTYFSKFKPLAETIWAADPEMTIVVGDFMYNERITDPHNFGGNPSGIRTLAAHQKILELVRTHKTQVWFDVHVWTEGPRFDGSVPGALSFIDALEKFADGARFKVVIFELNANNHEIRRALANALAIQAIERDGRVPVVVSANCLQPDGQNDNGWNQGLLFLNPSQVWLQPPGYVTQMFSRNYQPQLVQSVVTGAENQLDVIAKLSKDGKTLVLQVVNPTEQSVASQIRLNGFYPVQPIAKLVELSGPYAARNTAAQPKAIIPAESDWQHQMKDGETNYTFPARSITVIRWN